MVRRRVREDVGDAEGGREVRVLKGSARRERGEKSQFSFEMYDVGT